MHRFRKKSDAKRAQVPEHLTASSTSPQAAVSNNSPDLLTALPSAADFRTSLILPSLSKRFTLLRTPTGDPVSLDDIRNKIAEQRSRGAENQIFEDEEDMVVDALAQLRTAETPSPVPPPSNTAVSFSPGDMFAAQQDSSMNVLPAGDSDYPASIVSGFSPSISSTLSPSYPRSLSSAPSSPRASGSARYSSKRMSNNMFSSGRLHDTNYIRSVSKSSTPSSRSAASGSDSHGSIRSTRSARGTDVNSGGVAAPEGYASGESSVPSAPAPQNPTLASYSPVSLKGAREFTLQQVRRTSLALEEVIRSIEEEAEETIMVPRTSVSRMNSRAQSPKGPDAGSVVSTPVPWMTDEARVDDRDERDDEPAVATTAQPQSAPATVSPPSSPGPFYRPGTTSPSPRLPGYIPGMARPLTPRDADSDKDDGATGYSTTPRARSPAISQFSHHSNTHPFSSSRHRRSTSISSDGQSILPPSILRRGSGQQVVPLRTASPGYGGRSRGNSTSSPQIPSPVPSPAPDERFKTDSHLRRPLSPLSGAQTGVYGGGSRPGTPSSPAIWRPSSPLAQVHTIPSRDSDTSRPGTPGQSQNGGLVGSQPEATVAAPVMGPALPDSPFVGAGNGSLLPVFGWEPSQDHSGDMSSGNEEFRPPHQSAVAAKIAARAPTPVHTDARTPAVSDHGHEPMLLNRTLSRRSQKRMQSPTPPPQTQTQSPFASHTPSSSSNSSNLNVNTNTFSGPSPLFSPILNTSVSSLVSIGSSYHSWADENGKKTRWDQLVDYDSQRTAWQDMFNTAAHGSNHTDDASETLATPDKELHSLTGLTKVDLAHVQRKLVADAHTRRTGIESPRSPTRRRRMSTSRASLSNAQSVRESGANSPGPRQPITENGSASPLPRHTPENTSRANALLETVLNSIQSQAASSTPPSSDAPTVEPASTTDDSSSSFPSANSSGLESHEDEASALRLKALADALSVPEPPPNASSMEDHEQRQLQAETSQSPEEDSGEATEVPASQVWRTPQPPLHRSPGDSMQLARDVSRKAAAATAALKNPSQSHIVDSDGSSRRKGTRRIDFQKISSPHLVSSSISVDAVPIASTQASSPSSPSLKLSQRFKKLRGTLRTRPTAANADEVSPFTLSRQTSSTLAPPPVSSSLQRIPSPAGPTQTLYMRTPGPTVPASATDLGNFKVPVSPPPASAGPGLKSFFMARFRKSKKETEVSTDVHSGHRSSESTSPVSPSNDRDVSRGRQAAMSPTPGSATSPPMTKPRRSQDGAPADAERARSPTPDPATVNQLFNAASELGLDQSALNELLRRSTSVASRKPAWNQASTFSGARSNSTTQRGSASRSREGIQSRSFDLPRTPEQVIYKPPTRPAPVNRQPEGEIVRRTIIFASDNPSVSELSALVRKSSLSGGWPQRSESSASLHSAASGNREPPVPKLPASLGSSKTMNSNELSSSCDACPPDQSFSGVQNGSPGDSTPSPAENVTPNSTPGEQGQGPALEVLQLSNGEIVWSVLDSLRAGDDEDSESLFRRSMASSRGDDDLEVRFKEHRRFSSKGTAFSQAPLSPRRRQASGAGSRPETKLFTTSSSAIGRLIEDLSKNMDSGSFNFARSTGPTPNTAASTSTSFHSDASGQVERDLEALLQEINSTR